MTMTDKQRQGLDKVDQAMALLREATFPEGYIDNLQAELTKACMEASDPGWRQRCYVYMTFFGANEIASFMKIGVSNNPVFRVAGITTGNPLEPLWTFAIPFATRKEAMASERMLHAQYASQRAKGEWFAIAQASKEDAEVLADCEQRRLTAKANPLGPMTKVA